MPEKINYEELVQVKYHIRLEHQLNFNIQKVQSQAVNDGKKQGQANNQGQNAFLNLISGAQQSINQEGQQQTQSNKSIGY